MEYKEDRLIRYTLIASELENNARFILRKSGVFYCENRDDANFWSKILKQYAPNLDFESQYITISAKGNKSKGSGQVFNYLHCANANFLLFTDSDYHFLLDDTRMNAPFLAHTFTYSIENHWCYAANIKPFLTTKYQVEIDFDFELFLKKFSKIIYKAFIYTALDKKNGNNSFTIHDLEDLLSFDNSDIEENANDYLNHIQSALNIKTNGLNTEFSQTDFSILEQYLTTQKGLTQETAYLYLRGHTLYDTILQPILRIIKSNILAKELPLLPKEEKEIFRKKIKNFANLPHNLSFSGYAQIDSIFKIMEQKGFRNV